MMRNILLIPNVIELETIFDDEELYAESIKILIKNKKTYRHESIL